MATGDAAVTSHAQEPSDTVLRIVRLGEADVEWNGQTVEAETGLSIKAEEIGQVFGLALDDETPPNIYATATSAYGLRIEGKGKDAKWAPGQFGIAKDGGPGSIWKIDGETGEVSLFANVGYGGEPNSGPALGNIAFDPVSRQLFVSDRGTGFIHRFDLSGNDLGSYDHGLTGRPTTGLGELEFDPAEPVDITSDEFDPDDPESWGYAVPGRAVWGLATHAGRLYYAVEEGPQIWSVGIAGDGDFADDPRLELDLPPNVSSNPVSDITFTADRKMVLAQRGGNAVPGEVFRYHSGGDNAVIVFAPELPDDPATPGTWSPDPAFMPVGGEAPYRRAAGGVSIGHGYLDDGALSKAACAASLWATGDALTGVGKDAKHGILGQRSTTFADDSSESSFVEIADSPKEGAAGLMGDIAIRTVCNAIPVAELPDYIPPTCPGDSRCVPPYVPPVDPGQGQPPQVQEAADLEVVKAAQGERCDPGGQCRFRVLVRNVGTAPYYGPVNLQDTTQVPNRLESFGPTPPWSCSDGGFAAAHCRHEDVWLAPGSGVQVDLTFSIPEDWAEPTYRNCARLTWDSWQGYGDANPLNDEGCDYAPVCQPGEPGCGADLMIEQISSGRCEFEGSCRIQTRITNVGGESYTGPLSFRVTEFTDGLVLQNYDSAAVWSCGAAGAGNYQCYSAPVTLGPGDSREVSVSLAKPGEDAGDRARQCVGLNEAPGGPDALEGNNFACAEMQLCAEGSACPADLAIEFSGSCGAEPEPNCSFHTSVTNKGAKPFVFPGDSVTIGNDFGEGIPFGGAFFGSSCKAGAGTEVDCSKVTEAGKGLLPGNTFFFIYKYNVSGVTENIRENCVRIKWAEGASDPNTTNDEYCAPVQICAAKAAGCPVDLAVRQSQWTCRKGAECVVDTTFIRNLGKAPFQGSFRANISTIPDLTPRNPRMETAGGQPVGQCALAANGQIDCESGQIELPGGNYVKGAANYTVPEDFSRDTAEVCLELTEISGEDADPANHRACSEIRFTEPIEAARFQAQPATDLAVSKRLLGSCREAGAACRFRIGVENRGSKTYSGNLTITDALAPAGGKFVSVTKPWSCAAGGDGNALCKRTGISLAPQRAENFDVTFQMADDASGATENCATLDAVEGDGDKSNDASCVTVTIDGEAKPKPPEPPKPAPPPTPPQAKADLSIQLSGPQTCQEDRSCKIKVTVRNASQETFKGPLTVSHSSEDGGIRLSGNGIGWSCAAGGHAGMDCFQLGLTLPRRATSVINASFVPKSQANHRICAGFAWDRMGGPGQVTAAQTQLQRLGFDPGPVDGVMGRQTEAALRAYQESQKIPVTGEIDAETAKRLLSMVARDGDANPSNDRDCLDVTIKSAPKPDCRGGTYWNGSRCVCQRGMQLIGGKCQKPVVRPPAPSKPNCNGGMYWNGSRCVCPSGTQLLNGRCQRPIVRPPSPPPPVQACPYSGQIRLPTGQCICIPGMQVINGACRRPTTTCGANQIFFGGKCVCRGGWALRDGVCKPVGQPSPPSHGRH